VKRCPDQKKNGVLPDVMEQMRLRLGEKSSQDERNSGGIEKISILEEKGQGGVRSPFAALQKEDGAGCCFAVGEGQHGAGNDDGSIVRIRRWGGGRVV